MSGKPQTQLSMAVGVRAATSCTRRAATALSAARSDALPSAYSLLGLYQVQATFDVLQSGACR